MNHIANDDELNCVTHSGYLCSVVISLSLPFLAVDSVVSGTYGSSVLRAAVDSPLSSSVALHLVRVVFPVL
ncbi:hypothetical protein L6164_015723 [Bauhinia variegata]|uniref:Uncharacterized protein n=1 Tax=Bauhinia variegata TaxID=167791 RepID=A0ACB9NLH1_BAUVA|nr:hypothetical protein L6164_015723 [Bauhinia variegata]